MFTSSRSARSALITALVLVAVACTAPGPTASPGRPSLSPTPTTAPPTVAPRSPSPTPLPSLSSDSPQLLLVVSSEGGFIIPSARIGQLPTVVVDTDGNIYTPDPDPTADRLVPAIVVRSVGADGAARILAAMRDAGLDTQSAEGGIPGDAGVTMFTAEIDGEEIINRVAAGGPPGPGQPGGANNPALELLARLTDPNETWGASNVTPTTLTPVAYRVYVAPAASSGDASADWPLDQPLAEFGAPQTPDLGVAGLRSGVIFGDDARRFRQALGDTTSVTLVVSDGQTFQLWVRPLLPPELG